MSDERTRMLEAYFRLMNLNGASHVYRIAKEAGILTALGSESGSAAQVAGRCALAESPTRLVLGTLRVLDVVSVERDVYSLTPLARVLLSGSYQNLGDEYWAHLPRFLRTGEPLKAMDDVAQSEKHYQAQAAALAWMFAPSSEAAAQLLNIGSERGNLNIIDIGAGSAVWSLAMAARDSGTRVTAVDWPAVLEIAKAAAHQRNLSDRLTLLAGNFHELDLPVQTFDLAIVANVTHLLSPDANQALFARIGNTLKPNGEILVIDVFPGQGTGALTHALYVLGLSLRTLHARPLSRQELTNLLSNSGFPQARYVELSTPPHVLGMLIARRHSQPARR